MDASSCNTPLAVEFVKHCAVLGHDLREAMQADGATRMLEVPTLDDFRPFLASTRTERARRAHDFYNPGIAARRRLGQGLHDRGEASVFASGDLSDTDRAGLAHHLPLHVKAISVAHCVVSAGSTWDVSVRGAAWGLDDMEELYVVLNLGTLVLERGARLVVRGNVFVCLCQRLIVRDPASDGYQIGILPTPFPVDFGSGPTDGTNGEPGRDGVDGADGRTIDTEACMLGMIAREEPDPAVLCGQAGESGGDGTDGRRGRNGGMCKLAEITVRELEGPLTVFARAGRGGDGGDGGAGGDGGDGGRGFAGPRLVSGKLADGSGGVAGHGGRGGDGGRAGGGGIASNIYIDVSEHARGRVRCDSRGSEPGAPGLGGAGGDGGRPGVADCAQMGGMAGRPGRVGAEGARGRSRPGPWMFVNGRLAHHIGADDGLLVTTA